MSPSKKIDGVVDAVRLSPGGMLDCVRVYPRLGSTFSDHILLNRDQFVAMLKKGKRFGFGQRKASWGFTFDPSAEIRLIRDNNQDVIRTTAGSSAGDDLTGIPLF